MNYNVLNANIYIYIYIHCSIVTFQEKFRMDSKNIGVIAIIAIIISAAAIGLTLTTTGSQGPAGPAGPQGIQGPSSASGEAMNETRIIELIDGKIAGQAYVEVELHRGCGIGEGACHELRDPETGKYTLSYEAQAGTDGSHPTIAPDGTSMEVAEEVGPRTCLLCHASDPNTGRGNAAPESLRDIVHPIHANSGIFKGNYRGGCFSCHNVDAEGEFVLFEPE